MREYEWVEVISSNINKIAYDKEHRELLVEFRGGNQYYYINVPEKIFEDMLLASSKGEFLYRNIKGQYGYGRER